MVDVQQGVQHRYFMHNSLGRLLRVRQPEQEVNSNLNTSGNPSNNSWTAGFTYDNNGNVLTGIDAIGTTITNTYDALNRVTQRSYNDSPQTPTVNFYYDRAGLSSVPAYSKGQLTNVTSSVSESRYTEFDVAGRLKEIRQITDGQTYTSKYTYNLSGALIEEEYPSGRIVKNVLDDNGDLSIVQSRKSSNHGFWNYASHFSYNAAGAVTKMQMGNGLWETAQFNARLQSTQLGLGTIPTGASLWKVDYEFGELQTNGAVDATKNNGNIGKQTLTVPGTNFVQSYKYDSLHRLTEAVEKTDTTTNWSQEFEYDRYGNRIGIDQAIGLLTLNTTPTIDTNTNRFNPSQGFSYDKNGNIIEDIDPATNQPRTFVFNGDNKQKEIRDANDVLIAQYFYDGEGKRVKKVVPATGETTIFVYASGKLVAEYSTKLSQTPSVSYTTTDHLGTPRVITNELGEVTSRRDFLPFGEDIYQNVGGRTSGLNYGASSDEIRQKFTGYQKDNETGLDFAEARMYANNFGRFTAVDPLLASGKSANPQTFNRYVNVGNSPLAITDPLGLTWYFNQSINRYDWYDEETKKFKWGGGSLSDEWSLVKEGVGYGHFVYEKEGGGWATLDPASSNVSHFFARNQAIWEYRALTNYGGYGNIPVYGNVLDMVSGIKTGNVGRGLFGFYSTAAAFATAPRTFAAFAKEGAMEGASYFSGLPIFNPIKPRGSGITNEEIVQRAANFADAKRMRKGFDTDAVGGTKAHVYANDFLYRYQRRYGNHGLETENVSFMDGISVRYGQKGSVRFDVIDNKNGVGYDFKFGSEKNWPALKPTRITQFLNHGPNTIKTVKEVNPVRH